MSVLGVLIGLDIGSTRSKAVVVDLDGNELAAAAVPTPWVVDGPRVEMEAHALADAARRAVAAAVDHLDRAHAVLGLGVTGMGESGVLVDGDGEPRSPIIAWHDQRGDVARIAAELPDLPLRTGVPFNPTATIFKLPLLLSRSTGRRWLNVPEWVVCALGGEQFAEMSLAGRTGLQDLHTGCWWPEALAVLGIDDTLLPGEPRLGVEGAGTASFAPIAGARLAVAGHDHQVAAFAAGATGRGCLFESLGTADALTIVVAPPVADAAVAELTDDSATIGRTVIADRLIVIAGLRTGQILGRIARLVGLDGESSRQAVSSRAASRSSQPGLAVTLADGALTISGIEESTGPEELWRAAVDAADERTDVVRRRFERLFGPAGEVVVGGGWLHDPTIAAAIERRFPDARRSRFEEPGAVGAACIAGIAAGVLDGPFTADTTSARSVRQ